jgi:hypothetical protein
MPSGNHSSAGSSVLRALAGVESGVIGGVFMLAWLALLSLLQGRSIWSIPNLLASTFYGEAALRRGFRWTSLSGVALHLIMTAMAGLMFGVAAGGIASRGRVMLLGFASGMAWYFLWLGFFWKLMNPMVPVYGSGGGMLLAHLGLGYFLGSFPKYWSELKSAPAPTPALDADTQYRP